MQLPEIPLLFQVKKINGNDWEEDLENRNFRDEEYSEAIILRLGSHLS